jgi:four helix bundle protein
MIKRFEDLGIWKEARELCVEVHSLISSYSFSSDYALINQLNRSSGSIMDNIAEGFGRSGNREFIQFLSISKASCYEVKSQLYRALDRHYLEVYEAEKLFAKIESISNQIGGFMKYLNQSEFKGSKFRESEIEYSPISNY